uniref:FBD domain-containing protein n=1 Tax=Oryza rufipogon TaxID=4529 RepID=A0A0E0N1M9_ORYRU
MEQPTPASICFLVLCLDLDYNDEVLATLVSCLLNSSPNLTDLKIHYSSIIFIIDALSESNPCGGLCHFLVMNARILQKVSIEYLRSDVKPEHAAKLEAVRSDLHIWPRAFSECAAGVASS